MLHLLECHSNRLAQEVHEVHIMTRPHGLLEQVNYWGDIQAEIGL